MMMNPTNDEPNMNYSVEEEEEEGEQEQEQEPYHLFDDVLDLTSAKTADHDLQYLTALRASFPSMIVTAIPVPNIPLISFASAGHALAELDLETDSFASWRGYVGPSLQARNGGLAESVHFAKYAYRWAGEGFVVYVVNNVQYVLKERARGEHPLGPSGKTDELIRAVGGWLLDGVSVVFSLSFLFFLLLFFFFFLVFSSSIVFADVLDLHRSCGCMIDTGTRIKSFISRFRRRPGIKLFWMRV